MIIFNDVSILLSLGNTGESKPFIGLSMSEENTPCYFRAKMLDVVTRIKKFERSYYANLPHTVDTKEADNPTDNIMCQDHIK